MDLSQAQKELAGRLEPRYGKREASLIADWVMEHLTGLRKLDRMVRKTESLSPEAFLLFQRFSDELIAGRPVQYVLGESWFGGMRFFVDERVLIPRPETEELVEWVIAEAEASVAGEADAADGGATVGADGAPGGVLLDVGTGSGCIAITLSKRLPGLSVHACDLSEDALAVARRNAASLQGTVGFRQLNFLDENSWNDLPAVRWLVSNPPYIARREKAVMAGHVVEYEPDMALFVPDEDVLVFYRALGRFGGERLAAGGALYAEIHEDLGPAVKEVLLREGAKEVVVRKDLQGKDRMVKASY